MARILVWRAGSSLLTLFLVALVVFALIHLLPGDPLGEDEGSVQRHQTAAQIAELRALYHLDEPVHRQFLMWLGDLLRGDLGLSFHDRRPVAEKIGERLPVSMTLNALALALMLGLSVPLGVLAAWRPGSRLDRLTGAWTYALYALPVFWAGLLLQLVFSARLGWLPLYGLASDGARALGPAGRLGDRLAHLVLPTVCLAYGGLAYLSRFVRANLLEGVSGEFTRAARARGLSAFAVLVRHGFRQSAVPMLTLAGFMLRHLVAGSVLVEWIFAVPGLGLLFVDAVLQRDVPVVMGLTLLSSAATLGGIFLADLLYAVADPRVRHA